MLTAHPINISAVQGQAFDQTLTYVVDNGSVPWTSSGTHAANDVITNGSVTSPAWNGLYYRVTAGGGGASGAVAPVFPTTLGATVTDGALTLTCQAASAYPYDLSAATGSSKVRTSPDAPGAEICAPAITLGVGTVRIQITVAQVTSIIAAGVERCSIDVWATFAGPDPEPIFAGVLSVALSTTLR